MVEPLIEFRNVTKFFGTNQVLNNVSFCIHRGEVTTIIGKSGVGKSVLLKHIIGLIDPDEGEIFFEGNPVSTMKKKARRRLKHRFSYMFQGTALFDSLTVYDNIALPLKETTVLSAAEIKERVQTKTKQLDLNHFTHKYPSQLSGGMKKRVALARALVTEPEIVLFDEPTTGLDPIRKNAVHSMISDYQQRLGFTGVVVSHEIPDIFYISQQIAMLSQGRILFQGSPVEIQQSTKPEIRQFIHGLESRHDDLTGTATQRQLEKRYREEMSRLIRQDSVFSVILFAIENIDEIRQRGGQIAVQRALQTLAEQMRTRIRITDTCSRYGMNKIIVVLSGTGFEQAELFCTKLSRQLEGQQLISIPPYPGFSLSINSGFVEVARKQSLDEVVACAETRLKHFYRS